MKIENVPAASVLHLAPLLISPCLCEWWLLEKQNIVSYLPWGHSVNIFQLDKTTVSITSTLEAGNLQQTTIINTQGKYACCILRVSYSTTPLFLGWRENTLVLFLFSSLICFTKYYFVVEKGII